MEQNTERWLDWRETGIGSSDAAVIMGVSPYKTPYVLWLEMTGRKPVDADKFAFALGHRAEPIVRDRAEQRLNEVFEPACVTSPAIPFINASLDGVTLDGETHMEIKVNKDDVHTLLQDKPYAIPKYHYWQMQHQFIAGPAAKSCLYVSAPFREDFEDLTPDDLRIVPVFPALPDMDLLIQKEAEFIEYLATDTMPPLVEADGVHMKSATWKRNAAEWLKLNNQINALKRKQKRSADRLKELAAQERVARGYGVVVKNTVKKGNVQWKKVPELAGVDTDQYRAKSSITSSISGDE